MSEEMVKERVSYTFQLMLMIPGAFFWLALGCVTFGNYQVGWKSPTSKYETVINQVNPEVEAREIYQEQNERSKPPYKK